jgi:hypothetical protein
MNANEELRITDELEVFGATTGLRYMSFTYVFPYAETFDITVYTFQEYCMFWTTINEVGVAVHSELWKLERKECFYVNP